MRLSFMLLAFWGAMVVIQNTRIVAQEGLRVERLDASVGRFHKIEFVIHLDRHYRNPFDPSEVELALEIATPGGGRLKVPAFYCQDFERRLILRGERTDEWFYPAGKPQWRARFAPTEIGRYSCTARLVDKTGTTVSEAIAFECISSGSKGFVRVSQRDGRFLELSDGTPLPAIGQNLAFVYYGQHVRDTETLEEIFRKLSDNGANFVRLWAGCGDWALAIEWNKSAWGRSWEKKAPIVPMPGQRDSAAARKCVQISGEKGTSQRVSPCARLALKPNSRYVLSGSCMTAGEAGLAIELNSNRLEAVSPSAEWRRFERQFTAAENQWWLGTMALKLTAQGTAWVTDLSLKEAPDGPELLWEADVNRPEMGVYNLLDCFLLDQVVAAAQRHGIYLQVCLLSNPTRDLYMARLKNESSPEYAEAIDYAKRIFRYAVARWGWSTAVAAWEYFNEMDPGLPTDRFYEEVGRYLNEVDIYHHLRTTSAWHSSPKDWRHPRLDMANEHFYIRPDEKDEAWKDEVETVLSRVKLLRENTTGQRPAMLAEFGLATKDWRQSPFMKRDAGLNHFHNALWASALSGSSGTAMFWWWETLDRMDAYGHYKPLSAFLAGVPFTQGGLQDARATVADQRVRVAGLQGRDHAYLWLFNSEAAWHRATVEAAAPQRVDGATLQVQGLAPGIYQVQWWDTRGGNVCRQQTVSVGTGPLELQPPVFLTDIACRIEKARPEP